MFHSHLKLVLLALLMWVSSNTPLLGQSIHDQNGSASNETAEWGPVLFPNDRIYDYWSMITNKKRLCELLHEKYPGFQLPKSLRDIEEGKGYNSIADGNYQVELAGPLQIWVCAVPKEKVLVVLGMERDGVGLKAGLQIWDEIVGVNNQPFKNEHKNKIEFGTYGPILEFGEALDQAQGKGGLLLNLRRTLTKTAKNGQTQTKQVDIALPVKIAKIGTFSPIYPAKCRKSEFLKKELIQQITDTSERGSRSNGLSHAMVGLSLLATADPAAREAIENYVLLCVPKNDQADYSNSMRISKGSEGSAWVNGMRLLFLSEYFWATGDEKVYPLVQKLAWDASEKCQNVFGGAGHHMGGIGTYWDFTFGPPGALNIMGAAIAERAGAKVNHEAYLKYWQTVSLNIDRARRHSLAVHENKSEATGTSQDFELKVDPKLYFGVGYQHTFFTREKPYLGEAAFNTASAAVALTVMPPVEQSKLFAKRLLASLSALPYSFNYIHATPQLGLAWCNWAMTVSEQPQRMPRLFPHGSKQDAYLRKNPFFADLRRHMDYRKFFITMSRTPDGRWFYFYPKNARLNPVYGGGWGGDGYLGLDACTLFSNLGMLSTNKTQLAMQGNPRRNWMNPDKKVSDTMAYVNRYNQMFGEHLLAEARKQRDAGEILAAYHTYDKLSKYYSKYAPLKNVGKEFAQFQKKVGHKRLQFMLDEAKGQKMIDFIEKDHEHSGGGLFADWRKSMLLYIADLFPNHPISQKALQRAAITLKKKEK